MRATWSFSSLVAATLWLAAALPALAGPPGSPWLAEDIGDPGLPGTTDVDGTGVWTIEGGGNGIGDFGDSFRYVYQRVTGDGSITASLRSRSPGAAWAMMSGLMIREDDTPGAPNLNYTFTVVAPGSGLYATVRSEPGEGIGILGLLGTTPDFQNNLFMRLQRVGQEIAGFYSRDGQLWTQAEFSPQPIPSLKPEALFGMAVTANDNSALVTARFGQVSVQPGLIAPYGIHATCGDRSVTLQWRPLPGAVGFNLYRGRAGATMDQLVKLNSSPVSGTTFTDSGSGLVNGKTITYGIAAVFTGADGQEAPGPIVTVPATPVATLPGWVGCSLNEGPLSGWAEWDAATGEITTLYGSGWDFWNVADQGYFLNQPLDGDGQITVTMLAKPSMITGGEKAGPMIRESLDSGARGLYLLLTSANGLMVVYRTTTNGNADWPGTAAIEAGDLKLPITLRLTRQGRTITPEYSTDGGKNFQSAGDPITFDQDLPRTVYVGAGITSADRYQRGHVKLKDLVVRKP